MSKFKGVSGIPMSGLLELIFEDNNEIIRVPCDHRMYQHMELKKDEDYKLTFQDGQYFIS